MRFFKRGFDVALLSLGVVTVLCMIGAPLALAAAISIVGLPLAFLMAIIPSIFLFLVIVRAVMFAVPHRFAWVAGVIVAAIVLTAIPAVLNARSKSVAADLVAGDFAAVEKPFASRSLAVLVDWSPFNKNQTPCDEFCQRALLSGALDRVFVGTTQDMGAPLDPEMQVISLRIEKRAACPDITLLPGANPLKIAGDDQSAPQLAAELIRLQVADGSCLVQEPAKLGDADAVAQIGRFKQGRSAYSAGLDLIADTVSADRITLWKRDGAAFREAYRWTGVNWEPFAPVLAPTYVTGYEFQIANGFLRFGDQLNITEKYYQGPDRGAFFGKTLGLDLKIDGTSIEEMRAAALNRQLDRPGDLRAVADQLAGDFFDRLNSQTAIATSDAELAIRVLADKRLRIPNRVGTFARKLGDLSEHLIARMAQVMMSRLMEFPVPADPNKRWAVSEQLAPLGSAIKNLPDGTLLPFRQELEALARDERRRIPAWRAVTRLADFKADAVPTLLYLVEDSRRFKGDVDSNAWEHTYLAGITGLCSVGTDANSALGPLLAIIDRGDAPMYGSYDGLMVKTLLSLGADPATVWQRVRVVRKTADRASFDREVARFRKRPDCVY